MAEPVKRPHDGGDTSTEDAKRQRSGDVSPAGAAPAPDPAPDPAPEEEADPLDDFDALFDGAADDLLGDAPAPVVADPADEVARRAFAERVTASRQVAEADLPSLLTVLQKDAPDWSPLRRWRSASLLLACVARSSRVIRGAFVSTGLPVLGCVLQESVAALETGDAAARQEAGMWALACLMCLRSLSLGRAALWEHRQSLGKPFDRLHKWCAREKSALAAELRAPTAALCRRWRRQPKPAGQEVSPEQKAVREKVVEMICQGLLGIAGGNSPASPAPLAMLSPGAMPNRLVAVEVEAALYGRYSSPSHEYKLHARMLRSNLGHAANAKLREHVLTGELAPETLVSMDSIHLAPDALQEQRRAAERKAMKESVVEDMLPRMPSRGEGSPGRDSYNWSTAPPVFVKSPGPARQNSGSESDGSSIGASTSSKAEAAGGAGKQEARPDPAALPPLEPPPTPFRDFGSASGSGGHYHSGGQGSPVPSAQGELHEVELMATPAPDDEDEEQEALIQYLSKRVWA